MCIISPTDGYDLEGLSRDKTTQGDLVPLSKDLEGSSGDKTDFDWQYRMTVGYWWFGTSHYGVYHDNLRSPSSYSQQFQVCRKNASGKIYWRCTNNHLEGWHNCLNKIVSPYMSRIANNALLGGGVRVRVWIREQRKIKRRSKVLLSLCWQSWTSLRLLGSHIPISSIWYIPSSKKRPVLTWLSCSLLQKGGAALARNSVWRWTEGLRRWCRGLKTPHAICLTDYLSGLSYLVCPSVTDS